MELTRRKLLGATAALTAMPAAAAAWAQRPDTILHNGMIWTGAASRPLANAVAIAGGRVLAIGDNADVLALATPDTRKIDLGGAFMTPGFVDAHAHPISSGVELLQNVVCDAEPIATNIARLKERAGKTPAGQWIRGFSYDDGKGERPLTRQDLDAVSTVHPILVRHRGGHTAFVNSLALKLAGAGEDVADPPGGRYFRDANGRLNGRLGDAATDAVDKLSYVAATRDDWQRGAAHIAKVFTAKGVTSAVEANGSPEMLQGYVAAAADDPRLRISCNIGVADIEPMIAAGVHSGFGDDWVRVGAQKQFADGSISERTALLSAPYLDMDGKFSGLRLTPVDELYAKARRAHLAGWQLGIHANGDVAIDTVLTIFERLQAEAPRRDPRFRIEHCTLVNAGLLQRMKAVGAIPITFAGYVLFHGDVMHFYGQQRTRSMFALRDMIDVGLLPPSSSDYTASPSDPALWLQSQVTRADPKGNVWGPNQRITLAEALACGTINGARSTFEEAKKGSLEPGKLADLVVWRRDLRKVVPGELSQVAVERTMTGGRWVYES